MSMHSTTSNAETHFAVATLHMYTTLYGIIELLLTQCNTFPFSTFYHHHRHVKASASVQANAASGKATAKGQEERSNQYYSRLLEKTQNRDRLRTVGNLF